MGLTCTSEELFIDRVTL